MFIFKFYICECEFLAFVDTLISRLFRVLVQLFAHVLLDLFVYLTAKQQIIEMSRYSLRIELGCLLLLAIAPQSTILK